MTIIDLNGCFIQVTDLDFAIEQTEYFKDAHHIPPVPYDKIRQAYWTDMHNKLLDLKSQLENNK